MIEVVIAGTIYMASLLDCYDGDTCKIKVEELVVSQFEIHRHIKVFGGTVTCI